MSEPLVLDGRLDRAKEAGVDMDGLVGIRLPFEE
jgi:hypothetical protein